MSMTRVVVAIVLAAAGVARAQVGPSPSPSASPKPSPSPAAAAAPAPVPAEQTAQEIAAKLGVKAQPLSLVDALRTALKTNVALQTAVVEVDIAHAQVMAARGVDDMVLAADARYTRRRSDAVSGSPFQNTGFDNLDSSVSLTKPLRSGGSLGIKFDFPFSRQQFFVDTGGIAGSSESTSDSWEPALTLSFAHPLLRGRGSRVARVAERRARAGESTAEVRREASAALELENVINAYWELAFAYRDLEIRQGALDLAREQLRVVQAQVDVGRLPRVDALAVEQAIAEREEQVVLGEIQLADRSLAARETLGLEIAPDQIYLAATDLPAASGEPIDVEVTVKLALANNPGLRILRSAAALDDLDLEVAENALLPTLDFSAAAGPLGRDSDLGGAFERMFKFNTFTITAGANFVMPLGSTAAEGQVAVARAGKRRTRIQIADAERLLMSQVVRAANLLRASRTRLDVTARGVKLGVENLNAEQARYDVGRSTLFDLLMRQDALRQSQVREVRARVDYLKARATVDYVTGSLLASYGLVMK